MRLDEKTREVRALRQAGLGWAGYGARDPAGLVDNLNHPTEAQEIHDQGKVGQAAR